jgi:hypothetical protein
VLAAFTSLFNGSVVQHSAKQRIQAAPWNLFHWAHCVTDDATKQVSVTRAVHQLAQDWQTISEAAVAAMPFSAGKWERRVCPWVCQRIKNPIRTIGSVTSMTHSSRRNLYIDIDGVLILDAKPTPHCFAFLRWVAEFHRPYWLTTCDSRGQHARILRALHHATGSSELPAEIEALLRAIRPTEWSGSKISGIDLASDFVWIHDDPLRVEIEALRGRGLLNRLIVVDTDYSLVRVINAIKSLP